MKDIIENFDNYLYWMSFGDLNTYKPEKYDNVLVFIYEDYVMLVMVYAKSQVPHDDMELGSKMRYIPPRWEGAIEENDERFEGTMCYFDAQTLFDFLGYEKEWDQMERIGIDLGNRDFMLANVYCEKWVKKSVDTVTE